MTSDRKISITYKEFIDKMNECLQQDHHYQGVKFVCDESGYRLIAHDMTETSRMALDKTIFDKVSKRYVANVWVAPNNSLKPTPFRGAA